MSILNRMGNAVVVLPHDPQWRTQFSREADTITRALGPIRHELHHVGSTSIVGICAKPIIDMLLLVDDLRALDADESALTGLGYEAKGEFGIPERRYFRKDSPEGMRTHHLHAFVFGSHGAVRHIAFRDYMNAHPDAAAEYSALKRALASHHANDAASYIAGKDAFVKHHEALALSWWAARTSRARGAA